MSCDLTGALPAHVVSSPPQEPRTEEDLSDVFRKCARIMTEEKTTAQLKTLTENVNDQQKRKARKKLDKIIKKKMKNRGIPQEVRGAMMDLCVDLSSHYCHHFKMLYARRGESIILYLKCGSMETLLKLREIVLSGVLLRLLSDVITKFTQTESRIQLVVKADDYNTTLSYLKFVAGLFLNLLQLLFYYK